MNMFSFFKRKGKIQIPQWAPFENTAEYLDFKNAVNHYFKHYKVQLDFDEGVVKLDDIELFGVHIINLVNISKYCLSRGDSKSFSATIEEFMVNMRKATNHDTQLQTFDIAKNELGLRILTNRLFKRMAENSYIGSALFEDLFYFLVFDSPESVKNVTHAEASQWDISHSDLIKIGQANIELKYPQKITLEDILGLKIWVIENDFFYAPNLLLCLEKHQNLIGPYGSLVAIPNGDRMFIYPIEGIEATDALGKLSVICKYFYESKPNPISPNLYWHYNGDYEIIPYNAENPDFSLLPERFISTLRSLS